MTKIEEEIRSSEETIEDEDGNCISSEYKRMELKGESESDKDLIIYSLNESLQIHKEIVERIQSEKDEIEYQFEQEKIILNKESIEIKEKTERGNKQLNKLELIYKSLLKDLETKKLEYNSMENKFNSYINNKEEKEQEEIHIFPILNQMLIRIHNLCNSFKPLIKKEEEIITILLFDWKDNKEYIKDIIQEYFIKNQQLENENIITLFTEKFIMDTIINSILKTSIHPGIILNDSFEIIHDWIDKRNNSWASRLKQQISNFIVNQSTKEIETKKQDILNTLFISLNFIYNDIQQFHSSDLIDIIDLALKLNLAIKSQQDKFDIINLQLPCQFNSTIMNSINNSKKNEIILVITPPFVADGTLPFIIPAKVYCA